MTDLPQFFGNMLENAVGDGALFAPPTLWHPFWVELMHEVALVAMLAQAP